MKHDHKLFKGQTLAILTGGGDTPALNSSIESIRNRASLLGYKVYGIRKGWKGLLGDGDIVLLGSRRDGCQERLPMVIDRFSDELSHILLLLFAAIGAAAATSNG